MHARSCECCCYWEKLTHSEPMDYKPEEPITTYFLWACLYECIHYLPEARNGKQASLDKLVKQCCMASGSLFVFYKPSSLFLFPFYFFFSPSLTGCHHIFSQLPTTSYSATADLNTDLALSVPLRREQEIPYPRLPRTKLQGWILPVSSVFRLLEYMPCYFFQIPTHFTFQLITARTGKHCSWLKEMARLGV